MTGSLDKSFEGAPKTARNNRPSDRGQSNSRITRMFGGTQEKCVVCKKTVYPLEKVGVDGIAYHKACFKCIHGVISPSNYVSHGQNPEIYVSLLVLYDITLNFPFYNTPFYLMKIATFDFLILAS